MISSYKAAQLHMKAARSKAKGRPMKGAGWRLFQDGDEYVVKLYNHMVGRFLTNNTFVFTLSGEAAYPIANSLSMALHNQLPFSWCRVGKMQYRVDHRDNMGDKPWLHFHAPTNAPMLYDGITFDLTTGRCVNYRPDEEFKPEIDTEQRRVWLAALRAWKRQVKVAARLGAFDPLIAEAKACPPAQYTRHYWTDKKALDILYTAIKDGRCDTDLLRMFVNGRLSPYYKGPMTSMEMFEEVERVLAKHSIELRMRFGVIVERE